MDRSQRVASWKLGKKVYLNLLVPQKKKEKEKRNARELQYSRGLYELKISSFVSTWRITIRDPIV
jgi:hypothetical protein